MRCVPQRHPDQAATSARATKKKGPKAGVHVQLFCMKQDPWGPFPNLPLHQH